MGRNKDKIGQEVKMKINNITDKAIFGELEEFKLTGMLHYKEISTRRILMI